jgi:transposase InsO family protein
MERLMGEPGLVGSRRRKALRTTLADPQAPRPAERVKRKFAPDGLWVADFPYPASTDHNAATPAGLRGPTTTDSK